MLSPLHIQRMERMERKMEWVEEVTHGAPTSCVSSLPTGGVGRQGGEVR